MEMELMNRKNWEERVKQLYFEFQPIVNIRTGVTYGFEALLRDTDKIGYSSIADFFDSAYNESQLYQVDLMLREKRKLISHLFQLKLKVFLLFIMIRRWKTYWKFLKRMLINFIFL